MERSTLVDKLIFAFCYQLKYVGQNIYKYVIHFSADFQNRRKRKTDLKYLGIPSATDIFNERFNPQIRVKNTEKP